MKDKNNIDELFRKGFENLDMSPSPQVWENIQAKLEEERKERKVIPLWFRLGGIAALLAVMFTVGSLVFDPLQNPENQIVTETQIPTSIDTENTSDKTEIVTVDTSIDSETISDEATQNSTHPQIHSSQTKQLASSSRESKQTNPAEAHRTDNTLAHTTEIAIETDKNLPAEPSQLNTDKTEALAQEKSEKKHEALSPTEKPEDLRPSLFDAIAEENTRKFENTSDSQENRWKITPNVAPVYYNSLRSGSSIGADFSDNSHKGDVNMGYGVQVSYALNDRLSVRTGLNNVDLSYSTSDIIIATGPVSRGLPSVKYGKKDVVVTAISKHAMPENTGGLNLKNSEQNARLIQDLSYLEVPIELQYALIDRRVGVNLIGGVSTLFLGDNEISVKSDNFSDVLGSANNLSSVSFSTNVGIGVNYNLSKRFMINVEPMFKYQINPYTDSSVDFKPYYLGVYSGLSFKF